ncbi:MAG: PqiC family protein [Rhodovulum sp.]
MKYAPLALATLLAACSGSPARYTVPEAEVAGPRVPSIYGTVALREVSLPAYAASEEIHFRGPDAALSSSSDVLWADDPTRAVTGDLARTLGRMTGATVAADPWPFFDRPAATLEVRVSEMLAEADGRFRLAGQFFVAPESGGRGRSGRFAIETPIAAPGGPGEIAAARGQAVHNLAAQIARDGLR